jgi:hypothetical protein
VGGGVFEGKFQFVVQLFDRSENMKVVADATDASKVDDIACPLD